MFSISRMKQKKQNTANTKERTIRVDGLRDLI